jgi:RNA polymerase sigma factor (sigma-70 family)
MAVKGLKTVFHCLRKNVLSQAGAGLSDRQLVEGFLARRDEAAFEALVRRHGPMVLGVCRRIIGNQHDAEDAFQATFLVLVRKAGSIQPPGMVANWLYGVACNAARKAKTALWKRRGREKQVKEMPEPKRSREDDLWEELLPRLDEELLRLPDKYRLPIILCDLEGKTRKEAPRQLGWPEGTVASRLVSARLRLARRLARYGLNFSGGALATLLTQNAAPASLQAASIVQTVKAASFVLAGQPLAAGVLSTKAIAITEGVLKTMLLTKLKTITATILVAGMAVFGGETLVRSSSGGQDLPGVAPAGVKKNSTDPLVKDRTGIDRLAIAQSEMEKWRDKVAWSERMVNKGYLSPRQLEADKAQWKRAEIAVNQIKQEQDTASISVVIRAKKDARYEDVLKISRALAGNKDVRVDVQATNQPNITAVVGAKSDTPYSAVANVIRTLKAAGVDQVDLGAGISQEDPAGLQFWTGFLSSGQQMVQPKKTNLEPDTIASLKQEARALRARLDALEKRLAKLEPKGSAGANRQY